MFNSVGKIGETGNMTIFNADIDAIRALARRDKIDEHFIYNKKSGISSKTSKEGGPYQYPIWIRKEKEIQMCGNLCMGCSDGAQ